MSAKWIAVLNSNSVPLLLRSHAKKTPPFAVLGGLCALYQASSNKGFELKNLDTQGDCTVVFKGFPEEGLYIICVADEEPSRSVTHRLNIIEKFVHVTVGLFTGAKDYTVPFQVDKYKKQIKLAYGVVDWLLALPELPSALLLGTPLVLVTAQKERRVLAQAMANVCGNTSAIGGGLYVVDAKSYTARLVACTKSWLPELASSGDAGHCFLPIYMQYTHATLQALDMPLMWPTYSGPTRLVLLPLTDECVAALLMPYNDVTLQALMAAFTTGLGPFHALLTALPAPLLPGLSPTVELELPPSLRACVLCPAAPAVHVAVWRPLEYGAFEWLLRLLHHWDAAAQAVPPLHAQAAEARAELRYVRSGGRVLVRYRTPAYTVHCVHDARSAPTHALQALTAQAAEAILGADPTCMWVQDIAV